MKDTSKVKNINYEQGKVAKEQNKMLGTQFLTFVVIFLIVNLFVIAFINLYFFRDINISLIRQRDSILKNIETSVDGLKVGPRTNARISMIFYEEFDEEGRPSVYAFDNNILVYIITDASLDDNFNTIEEYQEYIEANKVFESKLFEYTKVGGMQSEVISLGREYHFMTLSFEIKDESVESVKYCKLMIMVNGELGARNQVIRIFIVSALLMFIFSLFASIFSSRVSIKPIKQALDKQLSFVSDASHELRTPLAIVQNKLENILAKSDKTVYEVSEDIAVSLNEISRLSKLTNDLLTLAHSDDENIKLHYEVFDLFGLISEVALPFKEMAEIDDKGFAINGEEIFINADKSKISQLVIILLDNALKYTSSGDFISITIKPLPNDVIISVSDTGIGIDDNGKTQVFERFYRADKARSREGGGNGLGLSIAKTIANSHKGGINVSNNHPKGTKFEVKLPKTLKLEKK